MVIQEVNGVPRAKWIKKSGVRNEPLDVRNYAMAALRILNPNYEALKRRKLNTNSDSVSTVPKRKGRRMYSRGVN